MSQVDPNDTTIDNVDGGSSGSRLFIVAAFLVVTLFVSYLVYQAVLERQPSMEDLLSRAQGVQVDFVFKPEKHDRKLERPPWSDEKGGATLSQFSDKTIFLNFWATTCQPCIDEIPSMIRLADDMKSKGENFVMVAVSTDPSWKMIRSFFQRNFGGMPENIVVLRDPLGESKPLMDGYGTTLLPETYMIQNGVIRHRFQHKHNWGDKNKARYFEFLLEEGKDVDGQRG